MTASTSTSTSTITSGDIMVNTRSNLTKKNLDEYKHEHAHAGDKETVAAADNILQEERQTMGGQSTTSKGQSFNGQRTSMSATFADPSPSHLRKSSKSLERTKVCNVERVIDELSYAVIAKIRKGIIEIQRREQQQQINESKSKNESKNESKRTKPRILCMVYTYEGSHASNLQAIVDTWATQCDGFFAASNVTDVGIGAVNIKNMYSGPEAYGNMWNKIEAMWKYAYTHYLNDYDYFHICGDDAYVIPDNLRAYLMGEQVNNLLNGHLDEFSKANGKARRWKTQRPRPLLLGFPVHFTDNSRQLNTYAAGGSGYTLNRAAVKSFYKLVTDEPINTTDSREDVFLGMYLAGWGITCSDTRDGSGAFRYLMNNPLTEYHDPAKRSNGGHTWRKVNVASLLGFDAFSNETVSIHLNYKIRTRWLYEFLNYTEEVIYRYHDFLNGECDEELLSHLPNATKIEMLAFTQSPRKKHPGTAYIVEALALEGMPPGYLQNETNL